MDDEWISAAEAYDLVRKVNPHFVAKAICSRAHDGLVGAKARLYILGKKRVENVIVPNGFWWATGHEALDQNWSTGDFETWIDHRIHCRAYGVTFLKADIVAMLPPSRVDGGTEQDAANATAFTSSVTSAGDQPLSQTGTGRPKSEKWTNWIAELVSYQHEVGIPDGSGAEGQDALIGTIEERLAAQGLESPSRSTVQPAVRAVLLRLRSAGK